jgi:GTP pyrophosphokinase
VGHHCVGAKVNGKIVPLTYELQTGDRVEILTQKSATPSRGWLNIVKTPSARSKIRNFFAKVTRGDDLQEGRDRLAREMRKHGMGISNAQSTRAIKAVAENLGYKEADDMIVNIGTGKESAQHVTNRLLKLLVDRGTEEASKPDIGQSAMSTGKMPPMITSVARPKRHETHSSSGIVVKGISNVLVKLANCCNPVPGDDVVGFVTRGRGVSVHRRDCPNARQLLKDPNRILDVSWEERAKIESTYKVEVVVTALDRMNLLVDVLQVISSSGVNVLRSSTVAHSDGFVEMRFLLQISNISSIARLTDELRAVDSVFEARREVPGSATSNRPRHP